MTDSSRSFRVILHRPALFSTTIPDARRPASRAAACPAAGPKHVNVAHTHTAHSTQHKQHTDTAQADTLPPVRLYPALPRRLGARLAAPRAEGVRVKYPARIATARCKGDQLAVLLARLAASARGTGESGKARPSTGGKLLKISEGFTFSPGLDWRPASGPRCAELPTVREVCPKRFVISDERLD